MAKHAKTDSNVSRRGFVGGAVSGIAASVMGKWSTASVQAQAAVRELRTDVVVCGGGIGGLTAAVRAQQQGANVILLEKAFEPGGTTKHSAGGVAGRTYEEARRLSPLGDPVTQRMVGDGVKLATDFYHSINAPIAGSMGARGGSITPNLWVHFMATTLERGGGQILVETAMLRLLTNRYHEVIGVLAEDNDGPLHVFGKAVVLATGGWMGNSEMVTQNISRYFSSMRQRNAGWGRHPAFTGDGYVAAKAIGAAPSTGGWSDFYGHMLPADPGMPTDPFITYSMYHAPDCVVVNVYGQRFTDETRGTNARNLNGVPLGGGEMTVNQETCRQPQATAAYIFDEPVFRTRACEMCGLGGLNKYEAYMKAGAPVAKADTLDGLAQQMEDWNRGMQAETLMGELTEYNQAAENGKAWALRIPKALDARPLKDPPFYALLGQTGITATFGGLRVNGQSQVLSHTGRPIKGLYGAGVDVGGWNNYVYLGNLILGAATGYWSGTNAAKEPEPRGGWDIGILTG